MRPGSGKSRNINPVIVSKEMGQTRGLEPPNTETTTRCLNHLATPATANNYISTVDFGFARHVSDVEKRLQSVVLQCSADFVLLRAERQA